MKLRVEELAIKYRNEYVFKDLNLDVREGEFISILGMSGIGKSTLLNVIAGNLKADSGSIYVDGKEVEGHSSHFAYMPQDDLLLPWRTVLDNVTLYGDIQGQDLEKEARENMKFFGLEGYENKFPRELSGGMRQRAAFLRTSLCAADILLLDEPFASLDAMTRTDMQDWLVELKTRLNKTAILVTHDMKEAEKLSDKVYILEGTPANLSLT